MAVNHIKGITSSEDFSLARIAHDYMHEMRVILSAIPMDAVTRLASLIFTTTKLGHTVFVFGNGGSAATADHIACDLSKNTRISGAPIVRCIPLASMVSASTAIANDDGFERVFADTLKIFGREGDLALAISTSGNSRNVIKALHAARETGMQTAALLGFAGGAAAALVDIPVIVGHTSIPHLEDAHNVINHMLTNCVRTLLRDHFSNEPGRG